MSTERYWSRIRQLIDALIDESLKDRFGRPIKWEQAGEGAYEVNLMRSTLRIRSKDGDGQYPYIFSIVDQNGQVLQSVEDSGEQSDVGWRLGELYGKASLSHSGAEDKLNEIIKELGIRDETFGRKSDDEPPF